MEEIVSLEKCVPVEIAKLLKIVGYNDRIDTFYLYNPPWEAKGGIKKGNNYTGPYGGYANLSNSKWEEAEHRLSKALRFDVRHPTISAPSYDMVIDWLLEHYGYFVQVEMVGKCKFRYVIVTPCEEKRSICTNGKTYNTRYCAMNAAFKSVLNSIKRTKT